MPKTIIFSEEEKIKILNMYKENLSYNYIAKKIGKCSGKTIARKIKAWLNEDNG